MYTVYKKGEIFTNWKDKGCNSELTKQSLWIRQNNMNVVLTIQ